MKGQGVPGPSDVVPLWVWYGFLVRILRTTKKVPHWRVYVSFRGIGLRVQGMRVKGRGFRV